MVTLNCWDGAPQWQCIANCHQFYTVSQKNAPPSCDSGAGSKLGYWYGESPLSSPFSPLLCPSLPSLFLPSPSFPSLPLPFP